MDFVEKAVFSEIFVNVVGYKFHFYLCKLVMLYVSQKLTVG